MSSTLATLVADPERIDSVPREQIPALLGECETLKALLWSRLQAPSAPEPAAPATRNGGPDRLLTVGQTADRLGVNKRWVYRHAEGLPFTKRLSGGTLRFSEKGLERWKETRKP